MLTATVDPFFPTPPVNIILSVLTNEYTPKGKASRVGAPPKGIPAISYNYKHTTNYSFLIDFYFPYCLLTFLVQISHPNIPEST